MFFGRRPPGVGSQQRRGLGACADGGDRVRPLELSFRLLLLLGPISPALRPRRRLSDFDGGRRDVQRLGFDPCS